MNLKEILILDDKKLELELFAYVKNEFIGLKENEKILKAKEIFLEIFKSMQQSDKINENVINSLITALNKALSLEDEEYLFKLIYEEDRLKTQIQNQKACIKNLLSKSMNEILDYSKQNLDAKTFDIIKERFLSDLDLLGILKETAECAFLNVIEGAKDIKNLSSEISKNLIYNAVVEGKISKSRILEISKSVLEASILIANESQAYANELLNGVIKGADEAMVKIDSDLRAQIKFAPQIKALELEQSLEELSSIYTDFNELLRELANKSQNPAKEEILNLLENVYDTYFANLKKLGEKTFLNARQKFDELTSSPKTEKNIENLKAELANLEKAAAIKLEQIKLAQNLETAKKTASELGKKVYDAAKKFLDNK